MALNGGSSCCSYYPKAVESLRLMLRYCASYTSVYWRTIGVDPPYDQIPEYGIRVDFDIPVTTHCLQCEDRQFERWWNVGSKINRKSSCVNATIYCTVLQVTTENFLRGKCILPVQILDIQGMVTEYQVCYISRDRAAVGHLKDRTLEEILGAISLGRLLVGENFSTTPIATKNDPLLQLQLRLQNYFHPIETRTTTWHYKAYQMAAFDKLYSGITEETDLVIIRSQ
ncbi:hypothetical protein IFM89_008287 [Coptis chinensis]|uniref:Uncharacterized protein n=1 Tax=Coptis chinensis TaxID=261450 RepID=A0A835LD95_9MAGN|nr:hypothetical protein IFM89_008287 [Coptis chinensis]